eukprot:14118759-Alexandrium_andersonii.AAC.1
MQNRFRRSELGLRGPGSCLNSIPEAPESDLRRCSRRLRTRRRKRGSRGAEAAKSRNPGVVGARGP